MRRMSDKEKLLLSAIPDKLRDGFIINLVYANDHAFGDSKVIEIVSNFIDQVAITISNHVKKARGMK
jgi:hypothetical protein